MSLAEILHCQMEFIFTSLTNRQITQIRQQRHSSVVAIWLPLLNERIYLFPDLFFPLCQLVQVECSVGFFLCLLSRCLCCSLRNERPRRKRRGRSFNESCGAESSRRPAGTGGSNASPENSPFCTLKSHPR